MQELIKIESKVIGQETVQAVSARELYLGLGLDKSHWARWASENIENNEFFTQAIDFIQLAIMASADNPNPPKDFAITLRFAQHLAMMARTAKSHEYRDYLLECERRLKELPPPRTQPTALDVADWVLAKLPNLCERSRQEIVSRTANQIVGFEMLPLPKVEERFWTAGELAEEFGCTANKIGRLANAHGLKTEKYGEHRLSKSRHSAKQVEQFYYNEKGRAALARLVLEIATH